MQQSNTYIIVFTAVLTIVLGGLLSLANQVLKPMQQRSIEIDTKKQILGAVVDVSQLSNKEILSHYKESINSIVVDINGEQVEKDEEGNDIIAENVDIAKNFDKKPEERLYPVFIYFKNDDPKDIESYILPVYGTGLWGPIWGYVALETDLNTIKGAIFDHETETPGLGARITSKEVQQRFEGKQIYDDEGNLESVVLLKGENNPDELLDKHHINGMSGATITGKGVTRMLKEYFGDYEAYIKKVKKGANKMANL